MGQKNEGLPFVAQQKRACPPRRPSSINRLDLSALCGIIRFVNLRLAEGVTLGQGFIKIMRRCGFAKSGDFE
jgi:hypothetical protein